jgi:hypothetical protein
MSNTTSTQYTTAKNSSAVDEKADIARLAALSPLDYDRQREAVAQKLGVRTTTLDKAGKTARTEPLYNEAAA